MASNCFLLISTLFVFLASLSIPETSSLSSFEVGFLPCFSSNFQHRLAIFLFIDQ